MQDSAEQSVSLYVPLDEQLDSVLEDRRAFDRCVAPVQVGIDLAQLFLEGLDFRSAQLGHFVCCEREEEVRHAEFSRRGEERLQLVAIPGGVAHARAALPSRS